MDGQWMRSVILFLAAVSVAHGQAPSYSLPGEIPSSYLDQGLVAPPQGPAPGAPFVDLDSLQSDPNYFAPSEPWFYQSLPDGLIYKSYLAGEKESRLSAHIIQEKDDGWLWDATLGGRIGIFRYGNGDRVRPQGFQFDVEGSAQVRLDIPENVDVRSVDFRGGFLGTYSDGPGAWKFGYYHLSSHLGDEFLLDYPNYPRLNFARDCLILGYSHYFRPEWRLYGEAAWAFYTDVSQPWEFQFGTEWAPAGPTGPRGAPFAAVNAHLRQELDFSGNLVVQAGWAWRGDQNSHLLRAGVHYYNGLSPQYSFYQYFEQQVGFGLWYDY